MVFSHRMASRFLILMIAAVLVMTGCAGKKQPQPDTKAPVTEAKMGIIDMNKIVKEHPRYNEYQALQLQINALMYQMEAKAQMASPDLMANQLSEVHEAQTAEGLRVNQEIEQNIKVSQKQAELQAGFDKKRAQAEQGLKAELEAYSNELDKNYELPIFNLKLKLKAATLSQSEAAAVNAEIEKLDSERKEKFAAKQAALITQLNQSLSAEYDSLVAELRAYQAQVASENPAQTNKPAAPIAANNPLPASSDTESQVKIREQLAGLQQKQALLEQQIVEDIRNKAGQIAVEKGLATVVIDIKVNVRALDITDLVIAGLKK